MEKEYGYIFTQFSTAFSTKIIMSLGKPQNVTFEFYLECRDKVDGLMSDLKTDMTNHDTLQMLKNELVTYKGVYFVLSNRLKHKVSHTQQYKVIKELPPTEIIQLITDAEIMQYELFFEQNPAAGKISAKMLFRQKHIYKTLREKTMVDIYKETPMPEYKLEGFQAVCELPHGRYIHERICNAYANQTVVFEKTPETTSFEYYVSCRKRIEPLIDAVNEDVTNRDALLDLKKELLNYKPVYAYHNRRMKRGQKKRRKTNPKYFYLRSLKPEDVILVVTKAEIAQYNAYFEQHKNAAYVGIETLLERRKLTQMLRDETLVGIYKYLYGAAEIRLTIEESLLENPKELYPAARNMNRHFIIHSGMTNTGKTYNALSALKKAGTGIYLGPLRLLAMEIQENLLMDNIMCNMITGEEESIVPFATHVASTVEMIDLYALYDTAVIDECQMIADDERGCAWTRAVLGVRAEEIHLCTAPDAVSVLIKIIEDCGDTYEVIEYERRTPIEYDSSLDTGTEIAWTKVDGRWCRPSCRERLEKIDLDKLQYGDALIAFRRADVLEIAEILKEKGIEASVIYGALPYNTRKQQLKRFTDGDTRVVVATDAIGMGLNLPIRRVIFTAPYKFDGKSYRLLKPSEIKQIAGRAGRKGIYDKGYVYSVAEGEYIESSLTSAPESIEKVYIDFDTAFIDIDSDIREILLAWTMAEMPYGIYEKINVNRTMRHIKQIEEICEKKGLECSKADMYRLATVTFDDSAPPVISAWVDYVKDYLLGKTELEYPRIIRSSVLRLETSFKKVDLYYSFCKTMGYTPDLDWIANMKSYLSDEIDYRLTHNLE